MIESLELQGFQKHKQIKLKLSKYITTIVGLNDEGKTALIRGLYWIAANEPHNDKFINWYMDYAKGVLCLDGHRIVRYKSKNRNYYKLDDNKPHKAPGFGVPEDIAKILNLGRINFQFQRDSVFLIGGSPSQISRDLNSVIDLEIMDDFLANVSSEARLRTTEEKIIRSRLKEAKQRKQELSWVKRIDSDLQAIEQLDKALTRERRDSDFLGDSIDKGAKLQKEATEAKEFITDASALVDIGEEVVKLRKAMVELDIGISSYEEAEELSKEEIPDITELEEITNKLEKEKFDYVYLGRILQELRRLDREINDNGIHELEHQLRKESGGICPTCGGKW